MGTHAAWALSTKGQNILTQLEKNQAMRVQEQEERQMADPFYQERRQRALEYEEKMARYARADKQTSLRLALLASLGDQIKSSKRSLVLLDESVQILNKLFGQAEIDGQAVKKQIDDLNTIEDSSCSEDEFNLFMHDLFLKNTPIHAFLTQYFNKVYLCRPGYMDFSLSLYAGIGFEVASYRQKCMDMFGEGNVLNALIGGIGAGWNAWLGVYDLKYPSTKSYSRIVSTKDGVLRNLGTTAMSMGILFFGVKSLDKDEIADQDITQIGIGFGISVSGLAEKFWIKKSSIKNEQYIWNALDPYKFF